MDLSHYIKTLPPLPDTVVKFEKMIQDDNQSIADVSRLLAKDPMMVANILKQANAPIYGFSREITSLDQAVALFGIGNIRGFVLASIVLSHNLSLDFSAYEITQQQFVMRAQTQQAIMSKWLRGSEELITLSSAAFMVHLGQIIISRYLKDTNRIEEFQELLNNGASFEEAEINVVGVPSCKVTAQMFKLWKFEPSLIQAIENVSISKSDDTKTLLASSRVKTVTLAINAKAQVTPQTRTDALQNCHTHNIECNDLKIVLENSY